MKKLKQMWSNLVEPYKHFGSLSNKDKFHAVAMACLFLGVPAYLLGCGIYLLIK